MLFVDQLCVGGGQTTCTNLRALDRFPFLQALAFILIRKVEYIDHQACNTPYLTMETPMNFVHLRRFLCGSTTEVSIRGESKAGNGSPCQAENLTIDIGIAESTGKKNKGVARTAEHAHTVEPTRSEDKAQHVVTDGLDAGAKTRLLGTRAPHISALGYFVENPRPNVTPSAGAALHGRALVGNHCSRPSSSKRPLPPPPAVTPGEQPYGASHPLSPTSMGSPPRRHRNSNWGEEGVPLAVEEVENSRQTVPFIVSGTMLG